MTDQNIGQLAKTPTCAESQVETVAQPDQELCSFYDVTDWAGLVRELVGHVAQLQDSAKRNVKPWEDTFPPTLLPAYIDRVNVANAAAKPWGEPAAIDWPEYHSEGMGCGLEDRGITDRYEAMRYGFDEALDQFSTILNGIGPLYLRPDADEVGRLRIDLELTRLARKGDQIEIEGLKALCDGFRAQLSDAAQSLETISAQAGRDQFMQDMDQVRGYANSRAKVARGALSASAEPAVDAVEINKSWMTDAELDTLFQPGSGNKAKRRIEAINKARGEA